MSFQNKGLWMSKDGSLVDGEIDYDNVSQVEPKRSHQLFMDSESMLFPSKKQAVNICGSINSFGGIPSSSLSPWGSVQGFDSIPSQLNEQLFDANRDTNFDEGNTLSVNVGSSQMGRKVIDVPFESNSSFGLSISHRLGVPKSVINYGGIRKVKVSEVGDSENLIAVSTGPSYSKGDSQGLTYGQEENVISLGDSYVREDDNYVSISQSYTKDACYPLTIGNPYKVNNRNSFNGEDYNIIQMAGNFSKGNDNGSISLGLTYEGYYKGDNLTASISPSNSKCESTIISFGSHNNDGYDLLNGAPFVQRCNTISQKDLTLPNGNSGIVATKVVAIGVESTSKKKEDIKPMKKTPPNNFPSNVRSLLSTGILDEVPVKYIAWSREKELRGIIKGSGYLCGCQLCNFSKVINAYEFERHSGCKTKHPNNHIYFENGKTIYGIVQELRNTPQNMLFDVIQTITGSPINQKSFRLWKESFLAATRELQRIYGKDERNQLL